MRLARDILVEWVGIFLRDFLLKIWQSRCNMGPPCWEYILVTLALCCVMEWLKRLMLCLVSFKYMSAVVMKHLIMTLHLRSQCKHFIQFSLSLSSQLNFFLSSTRRLLWPRPKRRSPRGWRSKATTSWGRSSSRLPSKSTPGELGTPPSLAEIRSASWIWPFCVYYSM